MFPLIAVLAAHVLLFAVAAIVVYKTQMYMNSKYPSLGSPREQWEADGGWLRSHVTIFMALALVLPLAGSLIVIGGSVLYLLTVGREK